MKVLLTNDDGISASGIQAMRRALQGIDGLEVDLIAPDSNRSATARSITTRVPLWVQRIEHEDGFVGYATDGTPVDCVRFALLGLLGDPPDMIVSGINHGSNLGDDVTYSGTVAAALEGVVYDIPAIAVSQQWKAGEMGYRSGDFDFRVAAEFAAELVEKAASKGMPRETLLNVNCPAIPPTGVAVTHLGKRIYKDELKQVGEEGDRRQYEIYGYDASFHDEEGSDLNAVHEGLISVTPLHFDLTDRTGFDLLRGWGLEGLLEGLD